LSELVAALSRALDLTGGEPIGHSVRACWMGLRVGWTAGLSGPELQDLYYALLLKDAGCSSNAAEVASWFQTDDQTAKADLKQVDWSRTWQTVLYALRHAAPGQPLGTRLRTTIGLARRGIQSGRQLVQLRCTRGAAVVRELGWDGAVPDAVLNLDEHWDGSGHPNGIAGPAIPLFSRILLLAQTAEIVSRRHGSDAARQVVRERRGTWFDPALCDTFLAISDEAFFADAARVASPEDLARDGTRHELWPADRPADVLDVARIFGQIVDAKSPWTARHSSRTAHYAEQIAARLGWDAESARGVRLAGYFHDLGKLGVTNALLDKPGPLTPSERLHVERHAELTGTILAPLTPLRPIAEAARAHHERLDGSGYFRGLRGDQVPLASRVIAVADMYDALTADRPYRASLSSAEALRILGTDRDRGRLWGPAVEAAADLPEPEPGG
jgi:HD-GYP domain-containing protein (c-di-GMP phosphodiesterase class II)